MEAGIEAAHPIWGGMGKWKVRSTPRADALSGLENPFARMRRSLPVLRHRGRRTPRARARTAPTHCFALGTLAEAVLAHATQFGMHPYRGGGHSCGKLLPNTTGGRESPETAESGGESGPGPVTASIPTQGFC